MAILPTYGDAGDASDHDEPIQRHQAGQTLSLAVPDDSESDDSIEFEQVGGEADLADAPQVARPPENIEIVLEKPPDVKLKRGKGSKRPGVSGIERKIRLETHKAHLLCLVAASVYRNSMLNDELLQARLLSLVPLPIQNAFVSFSPQTVPLPLDRSRLFDAALKSLLSWWWQTFLIDERVQVLATRSWVEAAADRTYDIPSDPKEPLTDKQRKAIPGELIRNTQSLMKRAVQMSGSRDMSPQLFVALCRAMDVPARLVVSLQPMDWRTAGSRADSAADSAASDSAVPFKVKSSGRGKGKKAAPSGIRKVMKKAGITPANSKGQRGQLAKAAILAHSLASTSASDSDDVEMEPVASTSRLQVEGSASRPISISGGSTNGDVGGGGFLTEESETEKMRHRGPAPKLRSTKPRKAYDLARSPSPGPRAQNVFPTQWAEVYSRPLKEWIPVDVTRKLMRCANRMEPPKAHCHNKMSYVIAIEQDNSVRDVTLRYVQKYGAVTLKQRAPSTTSKTGRDWWEDLLAPFKRKFELERDRLEQEQLLRSKAHESLPAQISGYKDHPLYVLERHLKREEVIWPKRQIGLMREEPVFHRSNVVEVKSAEQYMREGYKVKPGEQPLKLVKARAVTIHKRRAQELAIAEGREEDNMQGMYARWQTEKSIPPPIVDGKIPKNAYGNLDLFAPHMLPKGAAHLPYKGVDKVAKQVGVDYADAITGFEFRKQRAVPTIEGIVVAEENAEMVMDAFWASEAVATERAFTKKQERCLKRWKMLINGLTIRNRLQLDYAKNTVYAKAAASKGKGKENSQNSTAVEESQFRDMSADEGELTSSAAVRAPETQPREVHNALPSLKIKISPRKRATEIVHTSYDEETSDVDAANGPGKASKRKANATDSDEFEDDQPKTQRTTRSVVRKVQVPEVRPSRAAKVKASQTQVIISDSDSP